MYYSLELFQTATAMARHAGSRQAIVARNIANADTPGYRAQGLAPFQDIYDARRPAQMRATRPGHITASPAAHAAIARETGAEPAPNGNTVSLEDELLNSVAVSREHSRALAIYRHTMTVLRSSLGRS